MKLNSLRLMELSNTHVKISQLVANLQASRQQVVFPWLVPNCQQVCNKLLTTCNSLVNCLIMSPSLLHVVNNLFQTCYNKLETSSANTTCSQLVNRLVTICLRTCNNFCIFTRISCTAILQGRKQSTGILKNHPLCFTHTFPTFKDAETNTDEANTDLSPDLAQILMLFSKPTSSQLLLPNGNI